MNEGVAKLGVYIFPGFATLSFYLPVCSQNELT